MSDFLDAMSEASLARARALKESAGPLDARVASASPPRGIDLDLSAPGFDIIAEAKLASPSEGRLATAGGTGRVVDLARSYEEAGAAAISVLTEESRFEGHLDHLSAVAGSAGVPVVRKDFLVDPIQVLEARAAGASGVLLIARILPGDLLVEMTALALEQGMFVLVEVFDRSDVENAVRVFDRDVMVGVNCRDLSTLGVDRSRFASLAPHLPDHLPAVAESGIVTDEDAAMVAALGYRLALVGSSLVSAVGPSPKLESLIAAGRRTLTGSGR